MASIKADGNSIIDVGEEICNLSNEYLNEINDLFDKLSKINKSAWKGSGADVYAMKAKLEKETYVRFGEYLNMYGKIIKNTGTNVNRIIDKWENK